MQDYFAILVQPCSQVEAEAGTNNDKPMTALRTKQAIEEIAVTRVMEQAAEGEGIVTHELQVASPGWPPIRQLLQSISNGDVPETFNHAYFIGINNSVASFHGNALPGYPTVLMGFESYFKDNANEYGPEWYVEFANLHRPFYARQIFDPATTTIAAGSNGATLPQATVNVASTTNFPQYGSFFVNGETVAYTGKTSTTFTGCTGGTGVLATSDAVESEFRDNSIIQMDVGTDGYGSFSLYAGKLNPSIFYIDKDQMVCRAASIYFNAGTVVLGTVLQTNGSNYSPAKRYGTEDFAGDAEITITSAFVDIFRARINTTGTPIINAPTDPTQGQELTIVIVNRFGGTTISGPTWNAVFKMSTWSVNPAPGFNRSIMFMYDGTNWVEQWRSASDVPN